MTNTTLTPPAPSADLDDDVKIVIAEHAYGKLMCSTGDGCGSTCSTGSSACNSFVEDPA
jgi:FxLD family lantipeptide